MGAGVGEGVPHPHPHTPLLPTPHPAHPTAVYASRLQSECCGWGRQGGRACRTRIPTHRSSPLHTPRIRPPCTRHGCSVSAADGGGCDRGGREGLACATRNPHPARAVSTSGSGMRALGRRVQWEPSWRRGGSNRAVQDHPPRTRQPWQHPGTCSPERMTCVERWRSYGGMRRGRDVERRNTYPRSAPPPPSPPCHM
jgi:hypothetical protein